MQRFFENTQDTLKNEPVMRLARLIDWKSVENHMKAEYWRKLFRKGGRVPYDSGAMFRALLLARWHGLSYPKLERALRVRLDFMVFCGFGAGGKLPDACTLNRFNSKLSADGVLDRMVDEVETQLHKHDLELRPAFDAIVDVVLRKRIYK